MPDPSIRPTHLRASDLRSASQLAVQAVEGVTRIAEGVHQSVLGTLGLRGGAQPGRAGGLTGLVYAGVRGTARGIGKAADLLLSQAPVPLPAMAVDAPGSPAREAVLAVLNGVIGDHLVATGNPLATPMTLRHRGAVLDPGNLPAPVSGKVLLLVHGLCMNDLQWRTSRGGVDSDHGEMLAAKLGYTPIHLRYNTGLHIARNGRELSTQLGTLLARWPVPIEELSVVAHSMGGLVIRSACHHAEVAREPWLERLRHIAFLGTPHHGAPLERAGNGLDTILAGTPWTAPFAMLGKLRSAGITDLRHGHVVEDGSGRDRFERAPDTRALLPLPAGVACHAVAATTAAQRGVAADRLFGDGLVPLRSALGEHDDPGRDLGFARRSRYIAYRTNHMQLLGSPEVARQLLEWLTPQRRAANLPR